MKPLHIAFDELVGLDEDIVKAYLNNEKFAVRWGLTGVANGEWETREYDAMFTEPSRCKFGGTAEDCSCPR